MGQIGPFNIQTRAGQGAMATVWYGEHAETGTPVAIKVIDKRAPSKTAMCTVSARKCARPPVLSILAR